MTIRIEIRSTALNDRTVTQRNTNKQFHFKEQTAWAHTVAIDGQANPYPEKITITLPRGQETAYPEGEYTLHPGSFYVGNFGQLEMSPRLVPVKTRS
jgi:hypothetical protein